MYVCVMSFGGAAGGGAGGDGTGGARGGGGGGLGGGDGRGGALALIMTTPNVLPAPGPTPANAFVAEALAVVSVDRAVVAPTSFHPEYDPHPSYDTGSSTHVELAFGTKF
jgi:hypothetical protein